MRRQHRRDGLADLLQVRQDLLCFLDRDLAAAVGARPDGVDDVVDRGDDVSGELHHGVAVSTSAALALTVPLARIVSPVIRVATTARVARITSSDTPASTFRRIPWMVTKPSATIAVVNRTGNLRWVMVEITAWGPARPARS